MKPAFRPAWRWIRRVLPPKWWAFALVYLLAATLYGLFSKGPGRADRELLILPHRLALLAFAAYYGYRRSVAAHPANTPAYRAWLRATPWTPGRPLPLGPVMLVWQDLVVAGAVLALGLEGWPRLPQWLALVLLLSFNIGQLPGLARLRAYKTAYGVLWGVGLIPALIPETGLVVRWLIVLTPAVLLGQYEAMRRFNWWADGPIRIRGESAVAQTFRLAMRAAVGERPLRPTRCLALALLCGGMAAVLAKMTTNLIGPLWMRQPGPVIFVFAFLAIVLAWGRLYVYCAEYRPPISLAGRLATGRPIIPGYDQALAAPLLIVALGAWFSYRMALYGLTPQSLGLQLAILVFLALALGPSLQRWKLTGHHRIISGYQKPMLEVLGTAVQSYKDLAQRERKANPQQNINLFRHPGLPIPGIRGRLGRIAAFVALAQLIGLGLIALPPMIQGLKPLHAFPIMLGVIVMSITLMTYVVDRIGAFHPLGHPDYLAWLKTTPWRPGMPLPLGPAHPTGVDFALLALTLSGWALAYSTFLKAADQSGAGLAGLPSTGVLIGWLLMAILAGHLYDLTKVLVRTDQYSSLLGLGLLLGFLVLALPHLTLMIPLGLVMAAVGHRGVRRAWSGYPWDDCWSQKMRRQNEGLAPGNPWQSLLLEQADDGKVGRLNFLLSARVAPRRMRPGRRLGLILITGWWVFALGLRFPAGDDDCLSFMTLLCGVPLLAGVLTRLNIYLDGVRPPLPFLSRLLTLRWIIPGYDRVFLTPLAALLAAAGLDLVIFSTQAPPALLAIPWVAAWSILLLGGPSLRNWRLTGHYRLAPPREEPKTWLARAMTGQPSQSNKGK